MILRHMVIQHCYSKWLTRQHPEVWHALCGTFCVCVCAHALQYSATNCQYATGDDNVTTENVFKSYIHSHISLTAPNWLNMSICFTHLIINHTVILELKKVRVWIWFLSYLRFQSFLTDYKTILNHACIILQ